MSWKDWLGVAISPTRHNGNKDTARRVSSEGELTQCWREILAFDDDAVSNIVPQWQVGMMATKTQPGKKLMNTSGCNMEGGILLWGGCCFEQRRNCEKVNLAPITDSVSHDEENATGEFQQSERECCANDPIDSAVWHLGVKWPKA